MTYKENETFIPNFRDSSDHCPVRLPCAKWSDE